MKKRKVPSLAAAFVVTVIAGCGAPEEPHWNPPPTRNPPAPETDPTSTAGSATSTSTLPPAPEGWKVERNEDGTCTAYGPDPCGQPGCNPPPPQRVACPANLPK